MANGAKQGILSLKLNDKHELYNAYMGFLKGGGLFVPTRQHYTLGDEVVLLVTLVESNERLSVAGKVAWVTPVGAGSRTAGIGVHFSGAGGDGDAARSKIEAMLGGLLNAERPTQTM
ncbi:MAG TPA: PilZ domain-containing protein [Oleiagrimonas sp.]|nr:PilZ domain-containing protein [Oleiagrimonas sp.]